MQSETFDSGVRTVRLEGWQEFLELVTREFLNQSGLVFRGQARSEWKLDSTMVRLERKYPKTKNRVGGTPDEFDCPPADRTRHLRAFKEAVLGRVPAGSMASLPEREWWALAQHHGLATPLLDWTHSPFIAMFFAFAEGKEKTTERAVFACSWAICNGLRGDTGYPKQPTLFVPGRVPSSRLLAQQGVLMEPPKDEGSAALDLEALTKKIVQDDKFRSKRDDGYLIRVEIPGNGREDCLQMLNRMNINYSSLFPDLDGAAKHINQLWEMNFETTLGYFLDEGI